MVPRFADVLGEIPNTLQRQDGRTPYSLVTMAEFLQPRVVTKDTQETPHSTSQR